MSGRDPLSGVTPVDANGNVYPLATIDYYIVGTTTREDVFTTAALTVAHSNPITLGADGRIPEVFFSQTRMKRVFKDADGNTITGLSWDGIDKSVQRVKAASAPSPTYAGLEWHDTTSGNLKLRNSDNDDWIDMGPIDTPIGAAASITETITGTNTTKGVSPDGLQGLLGRGSDLTPSGGTVSLPSTGGKHYNLVAGAVGAISAGQGGREVWLHCQGASELTHNATSFEIDGGADYDTEAGDILVCVNKAATDASGSNWRVHVVRKNAGPAGIFPKGHIFGLTVSRASATTWSVATGECANENTSAPRANLVLSSAITKSLSAWVAGTGNGGLDTGAVATNTWYHVHLIRKVSDGTIDALISTSATAPTMPSGYEARRRIGAIKTDGSSQIVAFSQVGDEFLWDVPVVDVNAANPGTSAVTATLTVPTGVKVTAITSAGGYSGGASLQGIFVSSPDVADTAPQAMSTASLAAPLNAPSGETASQGRWQLSEVRVRTNTSAQVRYRLSASAAADRMGIVTYGWVDDRGKAA